MIVEITLCIFVCFPPLAAEVHQLVNPQSLTTHSLTSVYLTFVSNWYIFSHSCLSNIASHQTLECKHLSE
jgi:hypothetical protein